jgi:hypothetical protein
MIMILIAQNAIMADISLDTLQLYVFRRTVGIEQKEGEILFEQYGAPSHLSHEV